MGASGFQPDNGDWHGRGRFVAAAENDYLIDRERQKNSNFSGMEESPPVQDAAMQESMGAIVDRSKEHLVASDAALIRMRQRLFRAADALAAQGALPPGVKDPDLYHGHGDQFLLPESGNWKDSYEQLMREQYEAF